MSERLFVTEVGAGTPTLLLLHGMAGNGELWRPLVEEAKGEWPGRIVVPDLRGHGRSFHAAHYGYGHHAADVAALFAPGEEVAVLAHSMGALVGLALATGWYGVAVTALFGFSVKIDWTAEDLARTASLARSPTKWFKTREEAVERFLRVAGVAGLLAPDHPACDAGVAQGEGGYRLAADNATALAAGPDIRAMLSATHVPVLLACGARDRMVSIAQLRSLGCKAVELPDAGHNPHVEQPRSLWEHARPHLLRREASCM
jgi:pimeloyl-ACP methyl ester carboxylesterase